MMHSSISCTEIIIVTRDHYREVMGETAPLVNNKTLYFESWAPVYLPLFVLELIYLH